MRYPKRVARLRQARAEYGDAMVETMTKWLEVCDPAADALIAATRGWSRARLFREVEAALVHGIDAVDDPPEALRALHRELTHIPAWAEPAQIARGGAFFLRTHVLGGIVLGARSLILGYAAPAGNKPLVLSGRLERGVERRLAETSRFVYEVSVPGGMALGAPGFIASVKVRLIHAKVRDMIGAHARWDPEWGQPINQHDMAATIQLFSLVLLEGLERLGLEPTRDEAEDYLALWRYVGYLMGVEQELLPATRAQAERLKGYIDLTQGAPDDDARALTRALLGAGATEEGNVPISDALVRRLLGDEMADALGIGRTPWTRALAMLRPVVRQITMMGKVPGGQDLLLRAGKRYWEWAMIAHAEGRPLPLELPERLLRKVA